MPRLPSRIRCGALLLTGLLGCGSSETRAPTPFDPAADDPAPTVEAKNLYRSYCAQCHAWDGRGIEGMTPKARDLTDADWQDRVTDDRVRTVIRRGGAAVGLHPTMPACDENRLSEDGLAVLVRLIRQLRPDD